MIHPRIALAVLAAAFALPHPLTAQEVDAEKMQAFRKGVAELKAAMDQHKEKEKANPMKGIALIRFLAEKAKGVETAGLPDDLKTTYDGFVKGMGKADAVFDGWPTDPAQIQLFIQKKVQEDAQFLEKFNARISEVEAEMRPITAQLKELMKKYDVPGLGQLAPE